VPNCTRSADPRLGCGGGRIALEDHAVARDLSRRARAAARWRGLWNVDAPRSGSVAGLGPQNTDMPLMRQERERLFTVGDLYKSYETSPARCVEIWRSAAPNSFKADPVNPSSYFISEPRHSVALV